MSKTTAESTSASRSAPSEQAPVTIGGLARAAEVGVETIRYYQRRRLDSLSTRPLAPTVVTVAKDNGNLMECFTFSLSSNLANAFDSFI